MNIIKKTKQKAKKINLNTLKKAGIERDLKKYYILGNYPPLICLNDGLNNKLDIFKPSKNIDTQKELEVYLHFPFCEKKCKFCHFYSVCNNEQEISRYLKNLKKEIDITTRIIGKIKAKSVYIGGGTPSLMTPQQITDIIEFLKTKISIEKSTLFTFDINPNLNQDKLKKEKISAMLEAGVNRIVLGGVDLDDNVLARQGRVHSKKDEIEIIDYLKSLKNKPQVAADMMVGVPGQALESWNKTLETLIAKQVDCVMVFPHMFKATQANWYEYRKDPKSFPSVMDRIELYLLTMDKFKKAGYIHTPLHYFNRGKEFFNEQQIRKFESLDETELLAFGVSSFGFINGYEYFNIPTLKEYNECIEKNELPTWKALKLTKKMLLERDIMFRLFSRGVNKKFIQSKYNVNIDIKYKNIISKLVVAGLLKSNKTKLELTETGRLFAEEICDKFAGKEVKNIANKRVKDISPLDPIQRYNYNMIGHRLE
ncbi:MAG: coproporphyrinogen-III oxidase family protein [Patescibacteria group bacterium]